MKKPKLLIATTNPGKFKEIKDFLADLPFAIISTKDLDKIPKEPEESGQTLEDNALIKAKYYAEQTGLISLADDTGLFINALDGWPGVHSARVANGDAPRRKLVLEKMQEIPMGKRQANFNQTLALYDPDTKNVFFTQGETMGEITSKDLNNPQHGFGYDPIFLVTEKGKTYAEMTTTEKNSCSHRGKALSKMKYILQNQYGAKHIVVAIGLIIKDGKLLITQRNDPHRKDTHEKWEFPGGIVDFGETVESTVVKEIQEEAGYDVEIIKQLQPIKNKDHEYPTFKYQVYLVPYVCKIISGDGKFSDAEVLAAEWIKPEDHRKYNFLRGDNDYLDELMPELKQIIKKHNL